MEEWHLVERTKDLIIRGVPAAAVNLMYEAINLGTPERLTLGSSTRTLAAEVIRGETLFFLDAVRDDDQDTAYAVEVYMSGFVPESSMQLRLSNTGIALFHATADKGLAAINSNRLSPLRICEWLFETYPGETIGASLATSYLNAAASDLEAPEAAVMTEQFRSCISSGAMITAFALTSPLSSVGFARPGLRIEMPPRLAR